MNNDYIWHPFTQMKTATAPIHIREATGSLLIDENGKKYIDAISSWWVNIHGHAHPVIAEAIASQAKTLEQVIFAGFTHTPAQTLAEKLIGRLPEPFAKIFFSDNGSTSVEVAIKMALQYWHNQGIRNRKHFIALEHAYHGDTFGAMSVGGRSTFNAAFEENLFNVSHIPLPNSQNIQVVLEQMKSILEAADVAGFIFEPLVQGSAGMRMYDAVHLDAMIRLAHEYKALCIADEVMTGFGRTGTIWAIDNLQEPIDIICLSKGITGGFLPLGVTACSQEIYDAFYDDNHTKTFFHGHSYTANPLACAAANASFDLLATKECTQAIQQITDSHKRFTAEIMNDPCVRVLRQTGTILAIELESGNENSYFDDIRNVAYQHFLQEGVLLRPLGNIIYIMPPYSISSEELEQVYCAIKSFFKLLSNQSD